MGRYSTDKIVRDLDRLYLITEALWSFVHERLDVSDEDLVQRILELDRCDGEIDGRKDMAGPMTCPSCGRTIASHHTWCMYCGQYTGKDPFAR